MDASGCLAEVGKKVDLERYILRDLHPLVLMGTASDRYAGWLGQIYSSERYQGRTQKRARQVGERSFLEEVLPVDSLQEYFQHFGILEVDFTFYGPLLDQKGGPTPNYRLLELYKSHMGAEDLLVLKAPQAVTAQRLRRGGSFEPNPSYLAPELFTLGFYEPAQGVLKENLAAMVLEQEYQPKGQRVSPDQMARDLERFFSQVPRDERYHLELRTPQYLAEPVFRVMEHYGVGQVLSHWSWLPPLSRQMEESGGRFLKKGKVSLLRLMTPLGMRYEEAYARAYPFDHIVDGMLQPRMVEETARIMMAVVQTGGHAYVIVNNRSGGNAPQIAKMVAQRFLELLENTAGG